MGEKKIKEIYSKIANEANIINKNKYKILKEKENINQIYLDTSKKNNSIGIRKSYKKNPYCLHSINSEKNNYKYKLTSNNKYKKNIFKFKCNHLYHHNKNNNIFKGEINISSSYKNTLKKDIENNLSHNLIKNNASYLNTNNAKKNNKLYKYFSFPLKDDKESCNKGTKRLKNKINNNKDIYHTLKDINKKAFKSYNDKMRGKPIYNYRGLKTEINNFKKIKFLSINNDINKKIILTNRKHYNKEKNDELILKRNMKNKIKSDLCEDNSENSIFNYKKSLFLCYSPYKSSQILQYNSFKKKLDNKI